MNNTGNITDPWIPLGPVRVDVDGSIKAKVCILSDSPWFDGHFPDRPVLPGVALMALCLDAVTRAAYQSGQIIKIAGFRKIKFKQMVLPDSEIDIRITPQSPGPQGGYSFEITGADETLCAGLLSVTQGRPIRM